MSSKNLRFMVALACVVGVPAASAANLVTAPQGGVARWDGLAANECGIYGKRYAAVDAVCYYPVDIRAKPGAHEIALWDQDGKQHLGTLQVQDAEFPEVEMKLPESLDRYLKVSSEDTARAAKDREAIVKVLAGSESAAQFSLPLGEPTAELPKSADDFGSTRLFDADHKSLHSGRDYPVGSGNPVKAVADASGLGRRPFYAAIRLRRSRHRLVSMNYHLDSNRRPDGTRSSE